jgi:hypothetical protein
MLGNVWSVFDALGDVKMFLGVRSRQQAAWRWTSLHSHFHSTL